MNCHESSMPVPDLSRCDGYHRIVDYLRARPRGNPPVPTANSKPLTATANRLILAPDERSLQVDLVRPDRTFQVAGCVGSRDPCPSTPTQRAAAQITEAIGVRQY